MPSEQLLPHEIGKALAPFGFRVRAHPRSVDAVALTGLWVRKGLDVNRAVALLRLDGDPARAGELAQELKMKLAKLAGFFPFFYGLGLQVVWFGAPALPPAADLD